MKQVDSQAKFKVYPLREVPFSPRRNEVISGLLAEGEIAMLTGSPGSGKSLFAASMALAIATGSDFHGCSTESGPVVWVAAEKWRETVRRLTAISEVQDPLFILKAAPQAADQDDIASVIEEIKSACQTDLPRLLVIDTFARISTDLDENTSRDMGRVMRGLDHLSQAFPEAALLIIHHSAKEGADARGSSAITGAVDLVLKVDGSKAIKTATIRKANSVPEGLTFQFEISTVEDEFGDQVAIAVPASGGAVLSPSKQSGQSLKGWAAKAFMIIPDEGITQSDWRQSFGQNYPNAVRQNFLDAKKALIERQIITIENETVRKRQKSENRQISYGSDTPGTPSEEASETPPYRGCFLTFLRTAETNFLHRKRKTRK